MMKFIEHEGKLAASVGWLTNWAQPQRERKVYVSDIPIAQRADIVGLEISSLVDDRGIVWRPGATRPLHVNLTGWVKIIEVEPVKKPRKGKRQGMRYDWRWDSGQWWREWVD